MASAMLCTGVAVLPQVADTGITANAAYYKSGDFYGYETTGGLSVHYSGKSQTVSFPSKINGVTVVEVSLNFSDGEQIKTVNIPETVTKIFTANYKSNKTSLSVINVNSNNKTYSSVNGVLLDKKQKTLITYPPAKKDKKYTVPASVETIGSDAFTNLYLEELTIGKNVSEVDFDSFYGSSSLNTFKVDSANKSFKVSDGILYSKDMTKGWSYPAAKPGSEYKTPDSVEYLSSGFFTNCNKLKSITLGKKIRSVATSSISEAANLEKITVKSGNKYYKSIDGVLYSTYDNGTSLGLESYPVAKKGDYYKMPDNATHVYGYSFGENKNLNYIALSKNLDLSDSQFYLNNLSDMKQIKEVAFFGKNTRIDYYTPKNLEKLIIHGYKGSTAQKYATEMKMKFEEIKGMVPTSITINKTGMSLGAGESAQLAAVVKPFYATNKNVTWSTGNAAKATVSSGKVTAKAVGQTAITASTSNGKKAVCNITVKKAPEKVTLTKGILTIGVGETYTIGSGVNDGAASARRTYRTSNSTIVKMQKTEWTGVFKGVKPGVAYVTVRTYNGKESTCKVTVKNAPGWVKLNKTDITLKVGQKATLSSYIPSDSGLATRTYQASSYSNNGIIKMTRTSWTAEFVALKPGFTAVEINTYNGKRAVCYVTVKK